MMIYLFTAEMSSHPEESETQPYSLKGKNPWSVRSPGQSSLTKSTYNYGGGLEETDSDSPVDADSLVQTGETSHGKGKEHESSDGGEKASDNSEKRPSGKVIEQQQPQQELARLEQVITGIPDLSKCVKNTNFATKITYHYSISKHKNLINQ